MMRPPFLRLSVPGVLAALLLAGDPVTPAGRTTAAQTATAIVGATIIDGNGGPPLEDGTIVWSGNRITSVGPSGVGGRSPRARTMIDGTGKYVTPGFIDSNVHLSLYGAGETIVRYFDRNAALTLEAAQMQLKHGFTTVRDSYGSLLALMEVRDAIARGDTVGPRMLVAGNIVGWGGPYSISFSLIRERGLTLFQEQFNDYITQGSGEELMEMEPEDLRVAINDYLDLGPDFIKFGGTGHFSNPIMIGFSPRAQRVMVEESHKRGLVAETHSTSPEGLRISVEAGIDLIQHPGVLSSDMSDELIEMIVERGIVCAFLSNTVTGKAWQDHLDAQAERMVREAEEKAEAGDGSPGRGREEEDLGRVAGRAARPGRGHRDPASQHREAYRGRVHHYNRDRQLPGQRSRVPAHAQGREPGLRDGQRYRDRRTGRTRHDPDGGDRGRHEERRDRVQDARRPGHPRSRKVRRHPGPRCEPGRGHLQHPRDRLHHSRRTHGGPRCPSV